MVNVEWVRVLWFRGIAAHAIAAAAIHLSWATTNGYNEDVRPNRAVLALAHADAPALSRNAVTFAFIAR